jgi:formylglycine-generating enzyme required for sulfatase activity
VSWEDCQVFIKKLNGKTNGGYRLPTEAEWEYACRAGTTTVYSFGDSVTESDANYGSSSAKEVGSYKPNAFGLYDMHGNVFEWCEDWKADYPDGSVADPEGPATGKGRVERGGVFVFNESSIRSSSRSGSGPTFGGIGYGLRLARTADLKAGASLKVPKPDTAGVKPVVGNTLVAPFTEANAKEAQKELAKSLQKEVEEKAELGKGIKLEMMLIPAGKFMMGSPMYEKGRNEDEKQHEVTLTKPFYMGKYEVTQEQWEAVMGNNPSSSKGAKLPVTDVSWNDCQDFIKKLNASTKGGYRLPYEAEWEFACRAGTTTAYPVGGSLTKADANIDSDCIKAVGSYKPNAFGLYDMHGNVWEWCEGWYGDYPEGAVTDPKGPGTGKRHVLRGGSFNYNESYARSSYRYDDTPTNWNNDFGFRLARTADNKADSSLTVPKPDPAGVKPAPAKLEVTKVVATIEKELMLIPAGKFMMGSPMYEKGRNENEKQHEVSLTKPFYMGKYEVTQEQYEAVMGNNPSSKTKGAKLPVTDVSWNDCQEFIKKLNTKTNGGYRLPTEAEWEYACRAGTTTTYSYGDAITSKNLNFKDSGTGKPVAVGTFQPNAFGLHDMHGNVWEWCEDWYGDYPIGSLIDQKGPGTGTYHVLRGGSFCDDVSKVRSSNRFYNSPSTQLNDFGFRLAKTQ